MRCGSTRPGDELGTPTRTSVHLLFQMFQLLFHKPVDNPGGRRDAAAHALPFLEAGMAKRLVAFLALALLGASPLAAQNISGSISGTVVDPKGLAIPSAAVILTNSGTGAEIKTV